MPRNVMSRRMTRLTSRFINAGMVPLMMGLALDVYVVCLATLPNAAIAAAAGLLALAVFAFFWFAFPLLQRGVISQASDCGLGGHHEKAFALFHSHGGIGGACRPGGP